MIHTSEWVTSQRNQLSAELRDRYLVLDALAQGGMATVFRARDLASQEPVAIKVMRPRAGLETGTERFRREIKVISRMSHPGIVPLRAWGEAGELLYYVMPFIAGGSLHQRLQREARLGLEDALKIAREVADALGYSHSQRVLHRDVKPENILLGEDRAMIADFGLARSVGANSYQRLTETGMIVGTVYYLSPEQLREEPDLTARADVYSLGCILYEMLTGGPPFTGANLTELAARILRMPPPSARAVVPEVPEQVDGVIARAMAKAPLARYASMAEFAEALG